MKGRGIVVASAAAVAWLAFGGQAHAVPSFVRITGLTCNQCHVQFTPNPDFTWTGKKFRWNGMRTPWVQERIEAGEEGAITGRRLSLNFVNFFSMGFEQHILEQSKGRAAPGAPEPQKSPLAGSGIGNLSTFYSGPISDHIGVWNEIYFSAAGAESDNPFRYVAWDELDLKFVWNPGGNIVGASIFTEPLPTTFAFQFNSGAPTQAWGGGTAQAHAPHMGINAYGFWKDRLLTVVGVETGGNNNDWQGINPITGATERKMNFWLMGAYAFKHQDSGELWYNGWVKFGNDDVPMITSTAVNRADRSFSYSSNVRGISGAGGFSPDRTGDGVADPYLSEQVDHLVRSQHNLEYGFIDRGKWSARTAVGVSYNRERYIDGAELAINGVGWTTRWNYDRTWEWQLGVTKRVKWDYTDSTGVVHKIPNDMTLNFRFHRRLAMNFVLFLVYSKDQTFALAQNWSNGYSWEIGTDYYF
jgi:hypothetical protein